MYSGTVFIETPCRIEYIQRWAPENMKQISQTNINARRENSVMW